MNQIQVQLLQLLSDALFNTNHPIHITDITDTNALLAETTAQAVLPLIAGALNDNLTRKTQAYAILAKNLTITYEHIELHDLLSSHNIPYVILKGVASASYYPNPVLRTMGDVDFLIDSADFPCTASLLESIGFEKAADDDDGGIHIAFHRDDSTWEMHRSINGIPAGEVGEEVRLLISDIIETAVDYDEGNGIIKIPDDFHHGLVLLLHTASHLTSEGVGLRHLCDWAVFVNHFTDEQFRTLFKERLKACGLWRFAQLLSLVSVKYLNLPYQSWMGEADSGILEQFITDIMDGGNFGHKDEDRYRQIKYISNRGEHTVDQKSTIRQLWDTIGRKAKDTNTSRISVIADYARKVVSGERKLDNRETLENSAKRKRLYAEFKLFEKTE